MTPLELELALADLRRRINTALGLLSHREPTEHTVRLAEAALQGDTLARLAEIDTHEGVA